MFECSALKAKLESQISGCEAIVTDLRNDNNHFRVEVIYGEFEGKSLIEQHRIVNNALAEELKAGLHSISIKTRSK